MYEGELKAGCWSRVLESGLWLWIWNAGCWAVGCKHSCVVSHFLCGGAWFAKMWCLAHQGGL